MKTTILYRSIRHNRHPFDLTNFQKHPFQFVDPSIKGIGSCQLARGIHRLPQLEKRQRRFAKQISRLDSELGILRSQFQETFSVFTEEALDEQKKLMSRIWALMTDRRKKYTRFLPVANLIKELQEQKRRGNK